MRTVRCKRPTSVELFFMYASLVAITTTTWSAADSSHHGVYELCVEACGIIFLKCLEEECPGNHWPITPPQKCINMRSSCIEGCQPLKLLRTKIMNSKQS
ncbi:hypothetical protein LSAT2_005549 [Lamellibrachia satsuma]|nr:hypothetical protein LSAT2_005549 [Lamellibrachia satsuma]